jgi:hypothetical protein
MNILIVVVTFSIKTPFFPPFLQATLDGLLKQKSKHKIDIVISDTISGRDFCDYCKEYIASMEAVPNISLRFVHTDTHITWNMAFNVGINSCKEKEKYDFMIYCSDDTGLVNSNDLDVIIETAIDTNAGIVSAFVNSDHCPFFYPQYVQKDAIIKVRLGECINLHFAAFSKDFMQKYNYYYTDVLINFATESLLSFLCVAIDKEWITCNKVELLNNKSLEVSNKKSKGNSGYGIYKHFKTFKEIFSPGIVCGMGFEDWRGRDLDVSPDVQRKLNRLRKQKNPGFYITYDHSYYDGDKCKDPEKLYSYIKEHLFLPICVSEYSDILAKLLIYERYNDTELC